MGTRNLTVVILDGEVKVAQYGQWDGYLQGQGETVFHFIENVMDLRVFKAAVRKCSFLKDEEITSRWKMLGADGSGLVHHSVATKFANLYPELSRDVAANILKMIHKRKTGMRLANSVDFAGDSLFCEYGYVLDLDKKVLEIYKGCNQEPLTIKDRFFNISKPNKEYEQIKLLKKLPFSKVTKKTLNKLIKELDSDESES